MAKLVLTAVAGVGLVGEAAEVGPDLEADFSKC